MNKTINFNHHPINITYRDDSDLSVIDEFFVDKMYRSVETIISDIKYPIIDTGAHIGVFSIYSKIINPKLKIIAIEPELGNFKLLQANLKLNNCTNIKLIRAALVAEKKLNTKLYLSKNTHNHSTMPLSKNCIQVPATNLKKLMEENKIKKIGLLKMDIEGAEFNIIKTLKHKNIKTIENMVIEYHESGNNKREDLENITRQHGFSVEHFPNKFDKRFGLLVCRNKKTG